MTPTNNNEIKHTSGEGSNTEKIKKNKKTKPQSSLPAISMRKRLLFAFLLLVGIVLAVLWLFQTIWLDDIYRSLKLNDLKKCAAELTVKASDINDMDYTELDSAASEIATKNDVCISIYEIKNTDNGRSGRLIIEKHTNIFCFIHNIGSQQLLNNLYKKALQNDGECLEQVSIASIFSHVNDDSVGENVIFAKLTQKSESELLMLFNTELIPLDSTVSTLRAQLIIISIILLLIAVILAVTLSSRMSKPIREMSIEASKLALGDYNVNFDGGNCTETVNLSAALNRAAYELSRLDRMQKDLIANVSHDLRTPLTMISGYTEAMRDLPGEATPENMQIVIDETNRLTSLVNDMLEVSRYQGGTQKLKITRFNFTDVIRTTLERYAKLKEREGYVISFESDRDVFVDGDEGRLLQVMYNLVGNAVNYTGDDKTVTIRQTVLDNEVLIEVIDSGIGIPEDELPLVWERYYKVNDFHKRANIGTGLGLSIVKNILLLHGAEFGVKSKVGEGSNFWFKLKLSQENNDGHLSE